MPEPVLTLNSFGGGQDSTAITYKLVFDAEFRKRYAPNRLVTVMSNTGNEHDETYVHVANMQNFCREHGLEFHFITADMGYHGAGWQSLQQHFESHSGLMSVAYPKSCTDQLKIRPIYKFVEDRILGQSYGLEVGRKQGFHNFRRKFGRIRVLLGISAEEAEARIGSRDKEPKWSQQCLEKVYPLVDLGMSRQACQDYIRSLNLPVPSPSNCMFCPFLSPIELLWLYTFRPEKFKEWVGHENKKLEHDAELGEKNLGVFGKKRLEQVLAEAQAKFGHMTKDELWVHKMSHGHCVKSKY